MHSYFLEDLKIKKLFFLTLYSHCTSHKPEENSADGRDSWSYCSGPLGVTIFDWEDADL